MIVGYPCAGTGAGYAMRSEDIRVVGLGNGGGRMVDQIASMVPAGPVFASVNTDAQAIEACHAAAKLQIGEGHTDGLGAGGHISLGRLAAEEDRDLIAALFDDARLLVLVVGLGGGTGTGAAPVVLESARAMGLFSLCVATVPFSFEGPQRRLQADEAIPELRDSCDALLLLPNDRLFEADESSPLGDAFETADRVVGEAVRALWELLTVPGYINLGVADLKRVVHRAGGVCTVTYGVADGDDRAAVAARNALKHTLVEGGATGEQCQGCPCQYCRWPRPQIGGGRDRDGLRACGRQAGQPPVCGNGAGRGTDGCGGRSTGAFRYLPGRARSESARAARGSTRGPGGAKRQGRCATAADPPGSGRVTGQRAVQEC